MAASEDVVRARWAALVAPKICQECERPVYCRGVCRACYSRSYKKGATDRRGYRPQPAVCQSEGCDRPSRAGGLCPTHYTAMWRARKSANSTGRPAPTGE